MKPARWVFLLVLMGLLASAAAAARAGPFEEAARALEARIAVLEASNEDMATEIAALRARIDGEGPRFEQMPLVAHNIPGRIEAEDFDLGGEGVAYHDSTAGNLKGDYRAEDVDIEVATDADGRFNVGWIQTGEWLEWTVDVLEGRYDVHLRVAAVDAAAGGLQVSLDGQILGTVDVPATGGWQSWRTVTLSDVDLMGGRASVLRLDALQPLFNVNWIAFERVGEQTANRAPIDVLLLSEACAREVNAQLN